MGDIRRRLVVSLLAALAASGSASAAEPNAVGIVMRVTGETDPHFPAGEEIPVNTTISLRPGAELTFLHYPPNCELVTVAGGTLKLTKTAFTTDGDLRSEQGRPCPRVYELSGTGGGWIARDLLRLSIDPEIVFAGSRASQVAGAAVYEKGEPDQLLYRFKLTDHYATRPDATIPLSPNRHYVLKLTLSDQPQPVDYPFITVSSGAADSVVVLHVD